ncbi:polyamine aminopropyltransferase [Seinonella peptonophila]
MELWFTERQTPALQWSCRVTKTLYSEKTPYQQLDIFETEQFGRMMVLDGMVMTTDQDEFAYHELLTHIAMSTHPNPKQVLVVGGGDGGVIREVLRYPTVERAVLAEIDGAVVEAAKRFFPQIAVGFQDPKVTIQIGDGIDYVRLHKDQFDVIIIDSTEPVGPGEKLFESPFYQSVAEALTEDGLVVAQTESPWVNQQLIHDVFQRMDHLFPVTRLYLGHVPTYPSGSWTFTLGSKKYDPLKKQTDELPTLTDTRYYHPKLYHALFQLPRFVEQLTSKKTTR